MKKLLLLAALLGALCVQSFAQAGQATYIHFGASLPSGAPQWSIFSKVDGTGIYQCTNSPTCTSAGQWVTIGSAGSGTLTGVVTGASSGLTGGGLSGTLTMSLLTSCSPNQVLQWISSAWTCSSAGSGTVTSIATTAPITGGTISGSGTIACATCGVTGSPLSQFAATTSAQLAGVISDEIGSGKVVFATALQGTDVNVMTAGTVSGTSASLCTDASGGATTVSCPSGGPALGTAAQVPVMNSGATAYVPVTVSGDSSMTSLGVVTNQKINGVAFSGLATGILKNTTATGVPSIATGTDVASLLSASAPITMSGAGAFACATCVSSSSPGLGIAHFAGSTQAVTSSLIAIADLSATGTPSSTTYLRGDNTWATVAAGGLSGMTAGQVAIAATSTTVTSSEALAGAGAGITTGPISGTTSGHAVSFTGTTGQIQDAGAFNATLVGLGSVTNNAQTQAAIVPNTAPSAGQVLVGNAGGTAYAPVSVSGDSSMTSAGVMTNTKLNSGTVPLSSFFLGSNGSNQLIAAQPFVVNPQTATYPVVAADFAGCKTITVASGTFTVTLVASGSQPASGQCINVVNYGSGVVTIARSGQNINGAAANFTLGAASASAPTSATVTSDGTNYFATIDEATLGTVTSIATTAPLGGGTITGGGTLTCTTCVTSSSPGAGIAHFAGSTQAVTSSLIAIADLSATGTPSSTTYLRGDNTWATVASGGLSGMTSGQVAIAATASTVTSSEALTTTGTQIVTGTFTSPAQSQVTVFNSGGVLVNAYSGVNVDAQTGNYTMACPTDRLGEIEFNITATSTFTLPQAGSTACTQSSMAMVVRNAAISTAQLNITPTTSTFQPEAAATLSLIPGAAAFIYSDAISGTGNYHAIPIATPPGGSNVQTASYLITALDKDKFIVMNCASACVATLPAAPPTAKFNIGILSIGATLATVSLNSLTFNGSATAPTLTTGHAILVRSDGTNYFGDISASSGGLPTAASQGQVPAATGAGTTYAAQTKVNFDTRDAAGTTLCDRVMTLGTGLANGGFVDARGEDSGAVQDCGAVDLDSNQETVLFGGGGAGAIRTNVGWHLSDKQQVIGANTGQGGTSVGAGSGTSYIAASVFPTGVAAGAGVTASGTNAIASATLKVVLSGSGAVNNQPTAGDYFTVAGDTTLYTIKNCSGTNSAVGGVGNCVTGSATNWFYNLIPGGSQVLTLNITPPLVVAASAAQVVTLIHPIWRFGDFNGGAPQNMVLQTGYIVGTSTGGSCIGASVGTEAQENSRIEGINIQNCNFPLRLLTGHMAGPFKNITITWTSNTYCSTTTPMVPVEISGATKTIDSISVYGSNCTTPNFPLGLYHITANPVSTVSPIPDAGAIKLEHWHGEMNGSSSVGDVIFLDALLPDRTTHGNVGSVEIGEGDGCSAGFSCKNLLHIDASFATYGTLNFHDAACGSGAGTTNWVQDDINSNTLPCNTATLGAGGGFYMLDQTGAAWTNYPCASLTKGWCLSGGTWAYYSGGVSAINFASGGSTLGAPTGGAKGAGTLNVAGNLYVNGSAVGTGSGNVSTGTTNVYGAFLQDFSAATMKIPQGAGFTATASSTIGLDTTAKITHFWTNSADSLNAATTSTTTTTTQALFATAVAGIYNPRAIATGDLPTAIPIGNVGSAGLSGTAPVAIAATGAISLTGAAGQIPNGATGAFTATPTLGASGTLGSLTLGNATSGLLTLATATGAITSYAIDFPVVQPTGGNTFLSCTAANPAVCTWAAGGGGTTTNPLTGNNGGAGAASGSTFNGSGAVTFSYNTFGASPLNPPLDKSATGLGNPTADATFTYPISSTTGLTLAGTAPASVATATGTNATSLFNLNGVTGGADSNATGTGGIGSAPSLTGGNGGAGTGTNAVGGAGGNINITAGTGGPSLGTGINSFGGSVIINPGAPGTGGSGTAGKAGVVSVAGPGAGFVGFQAGTAITTLNTQIPGNTIIYEAPTSVTAYTVNLPSAAANGVRVWSNASNVVTESIADRGAFTTSLTATALPSGTVFLSLGGTGATYAAISSATETSAQTVMPYAGTFNALYAHVSAANGSGQTIALTMSKNAATQTVTCTIAVSTSTCSDVAHSFTFVAGDLITIKMVDAGTSTTAQFSVSVGYY